MRANRLERGDSVDRTIRNLIQQSAQYIGNHHSSTYDMAASNTPGSSSSMTSDFKITLEDRTSSGIGSMADSDIEGEEEEEGEAGAVAVQVTDKGSNNANLENNLQAAGWHIVFQLILLIQEAGSDHYYFCKCCSVRAHFLISRKAKQILSENSDHYCGFGRVHHRWHTCLDVFCFV